MKYPIELYDVDLYNDKISKEIILEVFITDKCNYNCYYCINFKTFNKRLNKQLNLNQLYDFIIWLNKNTGKHIRCILIGGEPTVHTDFLKFANATRKIYDEKIVTIESFTNLSQNEDFYIETFNCNIFYKVSFHYLNDQRTNNFLNKITYFYKNYSNNIQQIFIMLEHNNFDKCLYVFDRIYNLFKEKTICCLIDDSDKDNLYINRNNLYTHEQLLQYEKRCNNNTIYNEFAIKYNDNSQQIKSLYDIKNDDKLNFKLWKCNAGKDLFSIDFDGNIYPCSRLSNHKLTTLNNFKLLKFKQHICHSSICCNFEILKQKIFNK